LPTFLAYAVYHSEPSFSAADVFRAGLCTGGESFPLASQCRMRHGWQQALGANTRRSSPEGCTISEVINTRTLVWPCCALQLLSVKWPGVVVLFRSPWHGPKPSAAQAPLLAALLLWDT